MYTIYNISKIENCKKIKLCKDYKKTVSTSLIAALFTLILIFSLGLFPAPIMSLLNKIGIVEYTKIQDVYFKTGYKSSKSIKGWYLDKNGERHNADIMLTIPSIKYYNLPVTDDDWYNLSNRKVSIDAAYYTFMPSYEMLRTPSIISVLISYGVFLYLLCWAAYHVYIKRSILRNAESLTLIRPIGINSEKVNTKGKNFRFKNKVIWETPVGPCHGDPETKTTKDILESLSFSHEYCACYITDNNNHSMIVTEQNYPEIYKYPHLQSKLKRCLKIQTEKESHQEENL